MYFILLLLSASAIPSTESLLQLSLDSTATLFSDFLQVDLEQEAFVQVESTLAVASEEDDLIDAFVNSVAAASVEVNVVEADLASGDLDDLSEHLETAAWAVVAAAEAGADWVYYEVNEEITEDQYIVEELTAQVNSDLNALYTALEGLVADAQTAMASVDTSSISTFVETALAQQVSAIDSIFAALATGVDAFLVEYNENIATVEEAAAVISADTAEYLASLQGTLATEIAGLQGLAEETISNFLNGTFDQEAFSQQVADAVAAAEVTIEQLIGEFQTFISEEVVIVQEAASEIDIAGDIEQTVSATSDALAALFTEIQTNVEAFAGLAAELQAELEVASADVIAQIEPALAEVQASLADIILAYQGALEAIVEEITEEVAEVEAVATAAYDAAVSA